MERVNVIVGRFQPLTLGHIKGAEYVLKEYGLKTVFCIIETPANKLDAKHPFTSELIIKHNSGCKQDWYAGMYPIKNADIGKIAAVCREHNYEPVMWTCGSDRIKAYQSQAVEKYINMYDLDKEFKVVEIPRTDDDISATKVREAIKNNDEKTFKEMMPRWAWSHFKEYKPYLTESLTNYIRKQLNEDFFGNVGSTPEDNKRRKTVPLIEAWLKKYYISRYTINEDLSIDVEYGVDIVNYDEKELPDYINFNTCKLWFKIQGDKLTTLRGCPKLTYGSFSCAECPKLKTLEGGPEYVGGNYNCSDCTGLKSLEGHPAHIGRRFLYCSYSTLKDDPKIVLKGCLKHPRVGIVDCKK